MIIVYKEMLTHLLAGRDLDGEQMEATMDAVMDGELTPAQIGALLIALRLKGESIDEIAAAARSMRRHATHIDGGPAPLLDIVGTGGDGSGTFNISTTAALIAAGAGARLAKHGNRSISSRCGSADVLKALGVNLEAGPETVGRCVREVGIGFLFAPALHGAMKHAIGPRRELGVRTIFNMLGPLTNPAGADRYLLGVFAPELTEVFAEVLAQLGATHAWIVHGLDRSDEITGTTDTLVTELKDGKWETREFDPRPWLGELCEPEDVAGGDPEDNAALIRRILDGEDSPAARVARLNAAAALVVAGQAPDLDAAWQQTATSIDSGAAKGKLEALVKATRAG